MTKTKVMKKNIVLKTEGKASGGENVTCLRGRAKVAANSLQSALYDGTRLLLKLVSLARKKWFKERGPEEREISLGGGE